MKPLWIRFGNLPVERLELRGKVINVDFVGGFVRIVPKNEKVEVELITAFGAAANRKECK